MKQKISYALNIILLCLVVGIGTFTIAQTQTITLNPGQSVQIVCEQEATSTPIPTNTIIPTSTSTNTPQPTATNIPSEYIRFGPMDLTSNGDYSDWNGVFDLARDRVVEGARENDFQVIVPLVTNFTNQCTTDGQFDYTKCLNTVLSRAATYDNNLNAIVAWYVIDEPHDKGTATPTFAQLDALCGELRDKYHDVACGYNAPADWMYNGLPYHYIDMSLSQSNFGRLTTESAWRTWANTQMVAARQIVGGYGKIYLSFNADTYSPTAQDYELAMRGICSVNPDGVTFWSFRTEHTRETMTREVAIHLGQICNGANPLPTNTPFPTSTIMPTNTPVPTNTPMNTLIINHTSYADNLTQTQLDYARQRVIFFNHKSIGNNILDGLRLLASQNPTQYSINIVYGVGTGQGINHFQAGANGYPLTKIDGFETNVKSTHALAFLKFCTSDAPCVTGNTPIAEVWIAYRDMMIQHNNAVWWTMPLIASNNSRANCNADMAQFNAFVRDYVNVNGGILFDLADIESQGGTVKTNQGYEAAYPSYTSDGAHLSVLGQERIASALWVLFALTQ